MHELVQRVFLTLLSMLLVFIFFKNIHFIDFLFFHFLITILIYIFIIIFIVWFVKKVSKWMATLRYRLSIKAMTSFLILLFFAYEFFTPYFYSENYLKEVGYEKAVILHQLSQADPTDKERDEMLKKAVGKETVFANSVMGDYPNIDYFKVGEVIDFERQFNQSLKVNNLNCSDFNIHFQKKEWTLKLLGLEKYMTFNVLRNLVMPGFLFFFRQIDRNNDNFF
ncbi:hypothetical protein V7138_25150 [Bacillus sp. JJ1533]|uniref:hypothetical protein n=1 Tax=Bacillus sp. JJ1533 TaxID=3122959 RepID=UPI002FFE3BDD